jgi:genome maintenance exonuclease 1
MFNHLTKPDLPDLKSTTSPTGVRHYTTPEGETYPSITTVLGHKEKPWLKEWQNMLGPQKAAAEQKRCADRGTAIHEMIEHYLNNDDGFTKGYAQEHVRGFNQLKMRLNHIDNIRAQEIALWSDQLGVAGRVDCIGEYDGVLSIIDFKTSNNNKTNEMIEDYWLQTAAYAIMWYERTGVPIEDLVILMTVEKGMVPLVFRDKIDKYVKPLLDRIGDYKKAQQK